jgi:hypothetical protein
MPFGLEVVRWASNVGSIPGWQMARLFAKKANGQMDGKGGNARGRNLLAGTIGLVSCLLILLPAVLALIYVRAFGVSVVFGDAWAMVPLFDKWSSGTLRVSDLFAQHNEHRILFPRIAMLSLGVITAYNTLAEMYLILICFLVTLSVLLLAFRNKTRPWLFLFVPISFLVFSFRQYENIL